MYEREKEKSVVTIGESVYQYLRSNIIELNIKPGEMISIKDICTLLNVSRSPVRDALIKLEKEGLITSMPQKGTMISKIDLIRVAEERYLRECLEEKTIVLFMERHTSEDIKRLRRVIENQKQSIKDNDYRVALQQDDTFHKIFFEVTQKKLCWQTIQNTSGHYRRIRLLSLADQNISDSVVKQHEELIDCIIKKDSHNLVQLLHSHLTKLDAEELELLDKYPELFQYDKKEDELSGGLVEKDFLKMLK